MRRLCIWIVVLLVVLGAIGLPASASQSTTLRVGFLMTPGSFTVPTDEAHDNLILEALQEISKYTNWRYEFVTGTERELLEMLEGGTIDLMGGVYYRDELQDSINYPNHAIGFSHALLIASQSNDTLQLGDLRFMQNSKIAVVSSAPEAQRLMGYLTLNNIRASLIYTGSVEESLQKLDAGEVDIALVEGDDDLGYRVVSRFIVEPYYVVTARGRADLAASLDQAMSFILEADPDYLDSLFERNFSRMSSKQVELSPMERKYVQREETLRVAVSDSYYPLQYFDEEGMARGINIDIANLLAERTGLSFDYLYAGDMQAAIDMLQAGQADMVLGITSSRQKDLPHDFIMSQPYLSIPRVAVYNRYIEYPSDQLTQAVVRGMEFIVDNIAATIVYVDTIEEALEQVNMGDADYTLAPSFVVESTMQRKPYQNLKTFTLPGVMEELCIGLMRPVDPALLTLLNKSIRTITEEEAQDIVLQNTALRAQEWTLESFIYTYPMLFVVLFAVLTAIVIVVMVIFTMLRARHSQALYKTQYTDELTGALNLTGFRREAARLLQTGGSYALTYSSVRNFQYINDRYGYEEGDDVIRRVADTYRADMGEGEIFCRVSGATYAALVLYESQEALFARIDRFIEQLHTITPRVDLGYHIRMSAGIYLGEDGIAQDVFAMMDRANAALRQIKSSSEVTYSVYRNEVYASIMHAQEIESRMESALDNGDFHVYLQPKYDLSTMRPGGAEALVRWIDNGRMIPPGDFIPHFERNGFVAHIDRHVFTQCCKLLRRWLDEGKPIVPISINVSRVQLYSHDFIKNYTSIKEAYSIPDGLLELEFTESIIFEDVDRLINIVRSLRQAGFECSIDDFGKGYSSLTMLKNIPADTIKLDAQFFDTGIDEQRDTIIIESVIDIAKSLGMRSIAEGIEQKSQVRMLQMIGCDMIQGYVFSRPLDIATFERYLYQKLVLNMDPYAPLEEIPQA